MTDLKIEKNIPIPNNDILSVFKIMKPGDSVLVIPRKKGLSATSSLGRYIKNNNLKWKTTSITEGDGIRIWRVS